MVKRNPNFSHLSENYIFSKIAKRVNAYLQKHPKAKLIRLGVGDTTQPLSPHVVDALVKEAELLGTAEGYRGYGEERGDLGLREKIAARIYNNTVDPNEIYIADGCKPDLGRWQACFGGSARVAIQDPAYPVYVDGSLFHGVKNMQLLPCTKDNHFFPDYAKVKECDLIYVCNPNNPTGAVATHAMLEELVAVARKNKSIILYDAAYAQFLQDHTLPSSIYDIPGSRDVAIEMGSFSKLAGFTGLRLGWSVVPNELKYEDGTPLAPDWQRTCTTIFNGASNIVQKAGEAVLSERGWEESKRTISYYLGNAKLLKEALEKQGLEVYGGINAPFLWVHYEGRKSWDVFDELLEKYQLITTPGSGFGPAGEGYVRFSSFGHRKDVQEAIERLIS